MHTRGIRTFVTTATWAAIALLASIVQAQEQRAEAHASGSATAMTIGLPQFPGSKRNKSNTDDQQFDMGLFFGDFHLRVVVAGYTVVAPGQAILDFYRKPLAKYGEVLECDHGQPVGTLQKTKTGLTCAESSDSASHGGVSSNGHELRAGNPNIFRFVSLGKITGGQTAFALVLLELPKDK